MGLDSAVYFLFLGCVAAGQAVLPKKGRVVLLLCASLAFYAVSNIAWLVLLLLLCGLNYTALMGLNRSTEAHRRTGIFFAAVAGNLAVLILFKYEIHLISAALGQSGLASLDNDALGRIAAPLGLSYFTFQMLACITDAYRQAWYLDGGLARFVLFGFFFPQISSGPIPRAERLWPQLAGDKPTPEDRCLGIRLIAYGLFKKFVVANRLSEYVGGVFDGGSAFSTVPALLGCCFNVLQLYADFSGYVDIAIGSARFLGIRLDPNFDHPFVSTSVTELWRRWHMTLSFWLRDYLYMPLMIRIRNLASLGVVIAMVFTFAVCGLWHGATWSFLFFGVAQGVAMSLEFLTKRWRTKRLKQWPARGVLVAGWIYTMGFFVLSQVFFRAASLAQAWSVFENLFRLRPPHSAAELFAFRGPFNFALDFLAVGAWFGVTYFMRRESIISTPLFLFICGVLILFLGRLGTAHFIYAGF